MTIENREDGSKGRYVLSENGAEAIMSYSRASEHLIIIDHTEVPDAMRGTGAGARLSEYAVEAARKGGWKIIPLCPFFHSQVDRHPEWRDVIK